MLDYVSNIENGIAKYIGETESREKSILTRSLLISNYLEKIFIQLKDFIGSYQFRSESEEILFFKTIKPRIFRQLIYYRKIYNIEMNRPVSGPDAVRSYLNRELDNIQDYNHKRLDFFDIIEVEPPT